MKNNPLVSIIITTKNEAKNIDVCLKSIVSQTYRPIEIIVVDNNSTDNTVEFAKRYTKYVFAKGPERSTQRNFGVCKAKGEYVLILDADMKLSKNVVADCISKIQESNVGGIIIPEESYGMGFWADVKKLERSFYVGNDMIEAARFFNRKKFLNVGGFDETITGPEDWDLSQRIKEEYGTARVISFIYHNEGKLSFWKSVGKKYYYSKKFTPYIKKSTNKSYASNQMSLLHRYAVFLSQPSKLFKNPVLGGGVLILKTTEFLAGGIGFLMGARAR